MSRSILEIAQEACERDATAPAPAALFGTNNRIAQICRTAAKDTFREYLRMSGWVGMSEVTSTWVFSLQPGVDAYQLPPDFLRIIPQTEQRAGWPMGLVGPATPWAWAAWLYGREATATPMGWRIRNNAIWIEPTPTAAELVFIEYISRYPVVSAIREGDYNMAAVPPKANVPIVPRDGYLDLPDATLLQSITGGQWDTAEWDVAEWGENAAEILKRIDVNATTGVLPQVRREEFTADTDTPAFDDDYLMSIGMTFRIRRSLGKPYAEHAAEYEAELEMKTNTDGSYGRDFRVGGCDRSYETLPLGNGKWIVS